MRFLSSAFRSSLEILPSVPERSVLNSKSFLSEMRSKNCPVFSSTSSSRYFADCRSEYFKSNSILFCITSSSRSGKAIFFVAFTTRDHSRSTFDFNVSQKKWKDTLSKMLPSPFISLCPRSWGRGAIVANISGTMRIVSVFLCG